MDLLPSFTSKPPQNLDYDKENKGATVGAKETDRDGEATETVNVMERWQTFNTLQEQEYSFHNDFPSFDQLRPSLEVTYNRPGATSKRPCTKNHNFETSAPTAFSKNQQTKTSKPLMEMHRNPAALSTVTVNNSILPKRRNLLSRLCRHPQNFAGEEARKLRESDQSLEGQDSWTSYAFCSRAAVDVNNFRQQPDGILDGNESSRRDHDDVLYMAEHDKSGERENAVDSINSPGAGLNHSEQPSQPVAMLPIARIGQDYSSDDSDGSAVEALLDGTLQMHLNDSYATEIVSLADLSPDCIQILPSESNDNSFVQSYTICVSSKEPERKHSLPSTSKDCDNSIIHANSSDLSALSLTAQSLSSSSSNSTTTRLADKEVLFLNFRRPGGNDLEGSPKENCFQKGGVAALSSSIFHQCDSHSPKPVDQGGRDGAVVSFTPWYMSGIPSTNSDLDQSSTLQSLKERCLTEETSSSLSTPSRSPPKNVLSCELAKESVVGIVHPIPRRPSFSSHDTSPTQMKPVSGGMSPPRLKTSLFNSTFVLSSTKPCDGSICARESPNSGRGPPFEQQEGRNEKSSSSDRRRAVTDSILVQTQAKMYQEAVAGLQGL